MKSPILDDIRVIELASGIAGPSAGLQLSEAGAEVIKVEPPGGDPERGTPAFAVRNRGKRSVVLDPSTGAGMAALEQLLAGADVLIHDRTPQQAQALGLEDSILADRHPGLIVSAVTGWPADHPDSERSADELLTLARLGLLTEQPGHQPGPICIRMPFASLCAGWLCAIGVMARLADRKGATGGTAHTSIAQGALVPMTMHWARAERPTESFSKGLDKNTAIAIHRCSDGRWIHVHYSPDKAPLMSAALDAMGGKGVAAANARWGRNHTAPNFGANREIFATRPSTEWLPHLWANDVAVQPAAPFGEIYFDRQARENGYVQPVDDPVFGATLQPGSPIHLDPPSRVRGALRPLGGDTAEVCSVLRHRIKRPPGTGRGLPMEGLRVVDFGAYLAGPFASMLLADLGADVLKVEPPGGEALRYLARVFCGVHRGKKSLALDLKSSDADGTVAALARWADVFHHNIRIPAASRLGLDYDVLATTNPGIIGCHVSAYGPTGVRADWPGFDQMFQASGGWEVENGGLGNAPMWLRFGVTDHLAALASVFAVLLALRSRDRGRSGQMVSASLLGATLASTAETIVHPDGSLEPYSQLDGDQRILADGVGLYRCQDGWLAVAARDAATRISFLDLANGETSPFEAMQVAEAATLLEEIGVPCERVVEDQMDAFLDSDDNRRSGLSTRFDHPSLGRLDQIGAFWRFAGKAAIASEPAPEIGQHTRMILQAVGVPAGEIARLIAGNVAFQGP